MKEKIDFSLVLSQIKPTAGFTFNNSGRHHALSTAPPPSRLQMEIHVPMDYGWKN